MSVLASHTTMVFLRQFERERRRVAAQNRARARIAEAQADVDEAGAEYFAGCAAGDEDRARAGQLNGVAAVNRRSLAEGELAALITAAKGIR